MKNFIVILFLAISTSFSCGDAPKSVEKKKAISKTVQNSVEKKEKSIPISENIKKDTTPKKIPLPSQKEGVDYWTANNCPRAIPEPTVPKNKRPDYYSFQLNEQQGYGKEILRMENGYKLDITNSGCEYITIKFSYFLYAKDLDIEDSIAVKNKVFDLLEMTARISEPPYNFKTRISKIKEAVESSGSLELGKEIILEPGEIQESFMLEQLQERNGKVFLSYHFSMGPL